MFIFAMKLSSAKATHSQRMMEAVSVAMCHHHEDSCQLKSLYFFLEGGAGQTQVWMPASILRIPQMI
jgi:hypothetical protein